MFPVQVLVLDCNVVRVSVEVVCWVDVVVTMVKIVRVWLLGYLRQGN